jgi:hypothetical protein
MSSTPAFAMSDKIPFFCPVCESPINNNIAADSFKRVKCCDICETFIYYINKEKWDAGWRPSVLEARTYLSSKGISLTLPKIL